MTKITRPFFLSSILVLFIFSTAAFAKTVVVVGAGLAGLTTAYELQQVVGTKADVKLIEAKDRPGGRVFTVMLNGMPAELGGENIEDGGESPNFMGLVKKLGLETQQGKFFLGNSFYHEKATGRTFHVNRDLAAAFPAIPPEQLAAELEEGKKKFQTLDQVIDWFFKKHEPSEVAKKKAFSRIKDLLKIQMKSYEGGDVTSLSSRYALTSFTEMMHGLFKSYAFFQSNTGETRGGPITWVKGGNGKLVQSLAEKLGKRLELSSPLLEVKRHHTGVYTLVIGNGSGQRTVDADWVVFAIPAKVFKKIRFGQGTVPTERLAQFASIQYGTNAKILAPLPETQKNAFDLVTIGLWSWLSLEKKRATLYFSGDQGLIKTPGTYNDRFQYAEKAFQGTGLEFPKMDVKIPTVPFKEYRSPVGYSWAADPHIGGSYSYASAQTVAALLDVVDVEGEKMGRFFTPIDGKIYFVGEHTTVDPDIRGTMEAAVESGERIARVLIRKISQEAQN